jgi:pyruvate dehydrogenase E2 component (dihydrolipoamide acetyltransferase)
LQDADKKGLSKIGEDVKQLAQKARENSLKPEDYEVRIAFLCLLLLMDG